MIQNLKIKNTLYSLCTTALFIFIFSCKDAKQETSLKAEKKKQKRTISIFKYTLKKKNYKSKADEINNVFNPCM